MLQKKSNTNLDDLMNRNPMVRIAASSEGDLEPPIVALPKNPTTNIIIKAEKIAVNPLYEVDEIVEISSTDTAELRVLQPPVVTAINSPRVSPLTFNTFSTFSTFSTL